MATTIPASGGSSNTCAALLQRAGLAPACPPEMSSSWADSPLIHQMCASSSYDLPFQWIGCYNGATNEWRGAGPSEIIRVCMQLQNQDANWRLATCYACCSGPALVIAVPAGHAAIGTLGAGDTVLAATLQNGKPVWSSAPLEFSQAVSSGPSQMMRVEIGRDEQRRALALPADHVIALADATLTTVDRLAPGMSVLGQDGGAIPVAAVYSAPGTMTVHYLATSTSFDGQIDGHLLAAGGIVVGDYTLQIHFGKLAPSAKMPGYDSQPRVGTPEHAAKYPQSNPNA